MILNGVFYTVHEMAQKLDIHYNSALHHARKVGTKFNGRWMVRHESLEGIRKAYEQRERPGRKRSEKSP